MSRVSKRYAKALFALAKEEQSLDNVAKDLNRIQRLLKENNDFGNFIVNPIVGSVKQTQLINNVFQGQLSTLTMNFLYLLCEKKRLSILPEVIIQFTEILRMYKNEILTEVISAAILEEGQLSAITKNVEQMTNKKVVLETRQDSSLLGGFLVKIDDFIIDNSVRNQLYKLREKMVS